MAPTNPLHPLTPEPAVLPVTLRDGRYEMLGSLGRGSQGETFEARDHHQGDVVAVKCFNVRGATSWKDVELAEREARVLANLNHPNLPRYVDHFEENGSLYLVTQKVEGHDLAQRLAAGERFGLDDLLRLLESLADVFAYLHGQNPPVVHRDVKPGNIVLRPDGGFSLIDFGSVRDGLRAAGGSTVVGTFGYMAPEQFQGRALPASDLYGVGATLLTLLSGVTPDRLPHRGLAIDVQAALPAAIPRPWVELLERLVSIDPQGRTIDLRTQLAPLRPTNVGAQRSPSSRNHDAPTNNGQSAWTNDSTASPRSEWMVAGGTSIPFFVVIVLSLLRIALFVLLQILIPTILNVLSIFLGRQLRQSAVEVMRAGQGTNLQLSHWIDRMSRDGPLVVRGRRGWSQGGAPQPPPRWTHPGRNGNSHVPRPPRVRVGNFDVELPRDDADREQPPTKSNSRPR